MGALASQSWPCGLDFLGGGCDLAALAQGGLGLAAMNQLDGMPPLQANMQRHLA